MFNSLFSLKDNQYKKNRKNWIKKFTIDVANYYTSVCNPLIALNLVPGPKGNNYKEQVQWRDAATGKLLAASDYFGPATVWGELYVGYGGLMYDGLNAGHIMTLKVLPTSSTSTSTNSTGSNSTSTTPTAGTGG